MSSDPTSTPPPPEPTPPAGPAPRFWPWFALVHGVALATLIVLALVRGATTGWDHRLAEVYPRLVEGFARLDACVRRDAPASATWGEILRVRLDEPGAAAALRMCGRSFAEAAQSLLPETQWKRVELVPLAKALALLTEEPTAQGEPTPCRPAMLAAASLARLGEHLEAKERVAVPDCTGQLARTPLVPVVPPPTLRSGAGRWRLPQPRIDPDGALTYDTWIRAGGEWHEVRARTIDGTAWDVFDTPGSSLLPVRVRGEGAWTTLCDEQGCLIGHARATEAEVRDGGATRYWPKSGWRNGARLPDGVRPVRWVEGPSGDTLEMLAEVEGKLAVVRVAADAESTTIVPLDVDVIGERLTRWQEITRAGESWVLTEVHAPTDAPLSYRACRVPGGSPCVLRPLADPANVTASVERSVACHDGEARWLLVAGAVVLASADGGATWHERGRLAAEASGRPSVACADGALYVAREEAEPLTRCGPERCEVMATLGAEGATERARAPTWIRLAAIDGRVRVTVGRRFARPPRVDTFVIEGGALVPERTRRWSAETIYNPTWVDGLWLTGGL
ncbi:MAG: hypothetical protein IT385_21705 [Deltaproteobacteria bacterium]|nr:hypothetical protein [Deltaproteobacteria bacterium]